MLLSVCLCGAGWMLGGGGLSGINPRPAASHCLLPLQVPSWAMDMNVLMSAQLLMEQVAAEGGGPLLYLLYQHVLFHFHLWSPSDFAVRLGGCGDLNGGMPAGTGGGRGSEKLEPRFGPSEGTARPWGMWQGHGPVLEGQQKGPSSGRGGGGAESSDDAHPGHIQYMSSIVREHRQKLRKKYGVQFILDALRTHYR